MTTPYELKYALKVKQSKEIKSLSELVAFDHLFRSEVEKDPKNFWQGWFCYNEFRIANIERLPKTRPHVLTAGPFDVLYPYYHLKPLFAVADVVNFNCSIPKFTTYSAITCQPTTLFLDVLKRMPEGFKPDFYWDNQIEHLHYIPAGIEKAPFPIVASICHMFLHKSVQHVCELFDYVLPISQFHGDILRSRYGKKIIDFPFGLNWGSFDTMIQPCWDKSVDILLCFEKTNSPFYAEKRNLVIEALKKFKQKYGDRFSILIMSKLSEEDYMQLLKQSRISINVTGLNGPYNYRTVEAMCAGTAIFQYNWDGDFFENKFSDLFIDGVHGIGFTLESLESKLLYFLQHKEELAEIAKAGYNYLMENYNYKKLYGKLVETINKKSSQAFPREKSADRGLFHRDMIYYYQGNQKALSAMGYGVENLDQMPNWIRYNNLMVYSSVIDEKHPLYSLMLLKEIDEVSFRDKCTTKEILRQLYLKSKKEAPQESAWIVEWNYFMIFVEFEKPTKQKVLDILQMLYDVNPNPFDELDLLFKYSVLNRSYPDYTIKIDAINLPTDFMQMNIELMKVVQDSKARAEKHKEYAIRCAKYILMCVSQ